MGTISVEDALNLMSGDYNGSKVRDVLPLMVKNYLTHRDCPEDEGDYPGTLCEWWTCKAHSSEIKAGGPVTYVLQLARDMATNGWDPEAEGVDVCGDTLHDGHHRTLAAALAGLEEIPVN
jgi:hypothetical protein